MCTGVPLENYNNNDQQFSDMIFDASSILTTEPS